MAVAVCVGCDAGAGSGSASEEPPATTATTEPAMTEPTTNRGADVSLVLQQQASIPTDLGTVFVHVPADAGPDPLEGTYGEPPPFVLAVRRWVVPSCRLAVVVQTEAPLFPADQLVDDFKSSGLVWKTYDGGPRDGTQISSVATKGEFSIVVSGQSTFKVDAAPSTTELVEAIAASVSTDGVAGDSR